MKFKKEDLIAIPNTTFSPAVVKAVSELTLIVKSLTSKETIVVRKDFVRHATKLDIDNAILTLSWKIVEIEQNISKLEQAREEVAEAKYAKK